MKNRAFALLHRIYIAEANVPWIFAQDNPSKLRVESRTIDGRNVPVLVDDFEHTAILCGIFSESDGKLVGTSRLLLRKYMPDDRLEVERYDSLPKDIRKKMKDIHCDMELNRLAVDGTLRKKRCALLCCDALVSEFKAKTNGICAFTMSEAFTKKLEATANIRRHIGSFKYSETDPAPVAFCLVSNRDTFFVSSIFALTAGTFVMPKLPEVATIIKMFLFETQASLVGLVYGNTALDLNDS